MNQAYEENTDELIGYIKSGDKRAQSRFIEKNMGLVWSVVKRFYNRGCEVEDLFQIGCIGLLKAVEKFDSSYDVKFSTYAVPMIMGEIKRFLRDDSLIKVSRSLKELANRVRITTEILVKELGREPVLSEIASKLNVSVEEVAEAIDACSYPESLFSVLSEGDNTPVLLMDKIVQEDDNEQTEIVNKMAVREILSTLSPYERKIIILRYFKRKTQAQIADLMGISQVQVSRLEKKILLELKNRM